MAKEIQFYHHPWTRGATVHWLLEELGVSYDVHLLDYNKKEHKTSQYLAINPMGKIPTIVHRGVVVTESAAICVYLADVFSLAKLAPAVDDPQRGTYLRWIFFAASCTEPALIDKMYNRPAVEAKTVGYGSYQEAFDNLHKALLPGPFILGSTFSAADVYVASQLSWGMMVKAVESHPTFVKYVEACHQRPAFQRCVQQGQEMLKRLQGGGVN